MITTYNSKTISHHGPTQVRFSPDTSHHSLHASANFSKGELIVNFYAGSVHMSASYLTIQTGIEQHITLKPDFLQFVNHSCLPNVFFDTTNMEFLCIKDVKAGEELCFFYPSTEWEMAQPFECMCSNENCLGVINGAAHLRVDILSQYRLTDFIQHQLKQKRLL